MENFKEFLNKEAIKNRIELTEEHLLKFEKYKDLLLEWNEKINLTSIIDEKEIILKHFIDCLEIVKYIKEGQSIIDIGTGAGFPGIVIAIYFSGRVNITLVDALEKRLNFLKIVVDELDLKNITIIHSRAEDLSKNIEYREKYDIATARAVSALNILLELNIPLIKVGGKCLLLKGDNVDNEIKSSNNALKILKSSIVNIYEYSYIVHDEIYNRCLLEIVKNEKTTDKYPRNYGKIKKNPL